MERKGKGKFGNLQMWKCGFLLDALPDVVLGMNIRIDFIRI